MEIKTTELVHVIITALFKYFLKTVIILLRMREF